MIETSWIYDTKACCFEERKFCFIPANKQTWELVSYHESEHEVIELNKTVAYKGIPYRAGQARSGIWYLSEIELPDGSER